MQDTTTTIDLNALPESTGQTLFLEAVSQYAGYWRRSTDFAKGLKPLGGQSIFILHGLKLFHFERRISIPKSANPRGKRINVQAVRCASLTDAVGPLVAVEVRTLYAAIPNAGRLKLLPRKVHTVLALPCFTSELGFRVALIAQLVPRRLPDYQVPLDVAAAAPAPLKTDRAKRNEPGKPGWGGLSKEHLHALFD